MNNKQITLFLYLMAIPMSILVFCDIVIFKNNLYLTLHIILVIMYFIFFCLFQKIIQNEPIELNANSITIPSAPIELNANSIIIPSASDINV